jgi:hypothetical protein
MLYVKASKQAKILLKNIYYQKNLIFRKNIRIFAVKFYVEFFMGSFA